MKYYLTKQGSEFIKEAQINERSRRKTVKPPDDEEEEEKKRRKNQYYTDRLKFDWYEGQKK